MGASRWDPSDWAKYAGSHVGKTTADVFAARTIHASLNPFGVALRESRDSALNPESTAIIVGLDVTGSMGMIADALAREGLGTMVEEVLRRKPVSDPHILCMGVGDANFDRAPLQCTQFEADILIAKQLELIWLEKGGGGNKSESYNLPWYFAAMHTAIDCFEKRGRKGYLFTVGDEEPPAGLLASQIKHIMGDTLQHDLNSRELLTMASRMYHVFHIVVEQGSYASSNLPKVMDLWTDLLGQRVLRLSDHKKLAEVIVSTIEVNEGKDRDAVAGSWPKDTAAVVSHAIRPLVPATKASAVIRF